MTGLIEGTLCRLEGQLPGRVSRPGDNRYMLLCEAIPCDLEQRPTAWLSQRRPAARRT
jgi:hypothetical protein